MGAREAQREGEAIVATKNSVLDDSDEYTNLHGKSQLYLWVTKLAKLMERTKHSSIMQSSVP